MGAFDARLLAQRLVGGVGVAAFDEAIRERRAMRFEAALDAEQRAELFDLERLEALFDSEAMPLANVDVYEDGHLKRLADLQKKREKTGLQVIAELFQQGATIRLREVDACDRPLSQFVAEVRRQFAAQSQINAYLTPPRKSGFPPHFDITDVFVVQCLGAKQWRVFDDYTSRIDLPVMATNWEPDRFTPIGSGTAVTLSAGDVLYLPRGVMHQAFCTDRASMHLTISITPMTYADLIAKEVQRIAASHLDLRKRVPWSADAGDSGRTALIADAARACLQTVATRLDVATAIADERGSILGDARQAHPRVDLAGTLGRLFEGVEASPVTVLKAAFRDGEPRSPQA
jgi:hypothetical protein